MHHLPPHSFFLPFKPSSKPIHLLAMPIIGLVVDAVVNPDRMEEFLDLIEKDAVGSRLEPGCLRFGMSEF